MRALLAALVALVGLLGAAAGAAISFGVAYALLHGAEANALVWAVTAVFLCLFGIPAGAVAAVLLWRRLFPEAFRRQRETRFRDRTGIGIVVVLIALLTSYYALSAVFLSSPSASTSEPIAGHLCKKPGVRYAGKTAQGAKVCFTLTTDQSKWLEIAFTFVRASGCPHNAGDPPFPHVVGSTYMEGENELTATGQITAPNFTATIRDAGASGVLEDQSVCAGKTFKWSAHRAP
jgi:hypothetical protein